MMKKYDLEEFEFSQNYLFFYDKLEKANFYFKYIFDNKNTKLDDLKLIHMLDNLTNDGGQWNMFVNLIEKYGIVPKTNMDDHYHSKNSEDLNTFYNDFLRKAAKRIRSSGENRDKLLQVLLYECYKILTIFFVSITNIDAEELLIIPLKKPILGKIIEQKNLKLQQTVNLK